MVLGQPPPQAGAVGSPLSGAAMPIYFLDIGELVVVKGDKPCQMEKGEDGPLQTEPSVNGTHRAGAGDNPAEFGKTAMSEEQALLIQAVMLMGQFPDECRGQDMTRPFDEEMQKYLELSELVMVERMPNHADQ
jgi:hypothetical protein